MQSIEPATGPLAVVGATDPLLTAASTGGAPEATAPAVTGVPATPPATTARHTQQQRTADAKAFGRDSFAVFSVDKETRSIQIAIYDGDGKLLRMIPPDGVSQMARQIAAYRCLG